ncbi:MAG: histidine ammonia-lyase [Phycisphaerales bacterium]|nr:histidine ammonia-lyase [Phycisphaerales bacterium]
MGMDPLVLTGGPLRPEEVCAVARDRRRVELGPDAVQLLASARAVVDAAADGSDPIYGLNTGFGSLSRHRIEPHQTADIQCHLLRSHAAGVGPDLDTEIVRGMLLLLAASLSRGHSGVRLEVVQQILHLLNHNLTPRVPCRGSVGASGDLAPLAHAALVLIGEGEVLGEDGVRVEGSSALESVGLRPIELQAKEGLALINGTHLMASILSLLCVDAASLMEAAIQAGAMSLDAAKGSAGSFDARIHQARGQGGQVEVARRLTDLLKGSEILESHIEDDPRVQDPYCLRCMPQVMGAAMDALASVRTVVTAELGAVTDNPLIFADDDAILSGGNFHGMPLAIAADHAAIALCHIAGIAERRIFWLLSGRDTENPIPLYLSSDPGLHSGLMIAQYTAASLVNEMQGLSHPSSVGNVPTSAGIEDYNSMGATAARQARTSLELCRQVVSIELLVAAEGLEHQRPLRSSDAIERIHDRIRAVTAPLKADRPPSPDIEKIEALLASSALSG